MPFFFRNCTHILTQGKKFEDMFLVKIASKRTSLTLLLLENLQSICSFDSRSSNLKSLTLITEAVSILIWA